MIKNKTFVNVILITLMATFLTFSVGKVMPVYALANPQIIPELAPVFDTEIINLQDYIENNVVPPQFEIFNILLGLYVAGQGGFAEYKLHDPYANSADILDWLKSCGIHLYNHLIGMGAIGPDPITGIDYRPYIKGAANIAMGCAVKATQYEDVNDFVSDVNVQEKYFIPMDFGIQGALNYIFAKNGGLYEWQFENTDFTSNYNFPTVFIPQNSNYWDLLLTFHEPLVRNDMSINGYKNVVANADFYGTYRNLWFNTQNQKYYFCDDDGNHLNSNVVIQERYLYYRNNLGQTSNYGFTFYPVGDFSLQNNSWQSTVQFYIDRPYLMSSINIGINDFVLHYYYGASWVTKHEIFNTSDLNFDENTIPYYQQITNDYLLDVKGILNALLNETDLTNVILNNIYDLDAVKVEDPKLIRVTTEILEEIKVLNPPLPVNMNDIELYTDNTYLERVKEHARNAGDVFANYVAFWHNCDSDLVYTVFGAAILVLVGAFVGKWGHS